MRKVLIIKGTYGYLPEGAPSIRAITRNDGAIELPDEEAERLVKLRVAEYYTTPESEMPDSGVATGQKGVDGSGEGDNPPERNLNEEGQANGGQLDGADGEEDDDGDDDDGDIVIPEYNVTMHIDDLKRIFDVCGLTFKVGMSKVDMVAMLDTYFSDGDGDVDGDSLPNLSAEVPEL